MKVIFSRKGFDSAAGGGASPIIGGRAVTLPIPAGAASVTTYGDLNLGAEVAKSSKGRLSASDLCHHDPMFSEEGVCFFGQCGAAQTHLERQGVGIGDVFLFFGLFRGEDTGELHHRIFGSLEIEEIVSLAHSVPQSLVDLKHPHALAMHGSNDVIYCGKGVANAPASETLRLTVPEGPPSLWKRPKWLKKGGLSYHDRPTRWIRGQRLQSVARGQEFVADIGRRQEPREWLQKIIAEIGRAY